MQKLRNKVLKFGTSAVMMGSRISGFMISFRVEGTMEYVINDEYTHIQAIVISTNGIKMKMAREMPISSITTLPTEAAEEAITAMLNSDSSSNTGVAVSTSS